MDNNIDIDYKLIETNTDNLNEFLPENQFYDYPKKPDISDYTLEPHKK
jgi:hypothetical protein